MGGMRGGPGGGGVSNLLRNPQVQEELKLSDEQKDQLREVAEQAFADMRGFFPDREEMEKLSEEERAAKRQEAMEKFRKEAEKRAPRIEKKIGEILKKEQYKRLKQIEMQRQGVDALMRPDIAQALEISEDQQKEIKEVLEARNKKMEGLGEEMRAMFQGGGFRDMSEEERGEMRQKMEKLGEKRRTITSKAQKEAMGKLTDEQKAKMPDLMGERFEFRRPEGGPGRSGEGRRRPDGPRGEGQRGERREGERGRRPRTEST